jgi:hypothetical protein
MALNLKQAIKEGRLQEFAEENEIQDPHPEGESRFWRLLGAMLGPSASKETSDAEHAEGSDETRTPPDTSEGV